MKHLYFLGALLAASSLQLRAATTIKVDAKAGRSAVSPYIFGRNGATSDQASVGDYTDELIGKIRDCGTRFVRQNNGNNCSKYNWELKLHSSPDWYNNVYDCDWDLSASRLQEKLPDVQGMYGFQLLGKASGSKDYNFNDWEWNHSQWGDWCSKNACGGGKFDADNNLSVEGNPDLYLVDWPAQKSAAIIKHWQDLGYNMQNLRYWNMDNEVEMWGWTHDDVIKDFNQDEMDKYIARYVECAKAARSYMPDVKLCGPVAGSEWTWYHPCNDMPKLNGKEVCWLEFFIARCAEEQKKSGVRLLDVLDIHFYPGDDNATDLLQSHRVLFDRDYVYPGANGVKTVNGGWDNSQDKEYIFGRCQDWIDKYFGPNSGITFGISEYNSTTENVSTMVHALTYASFLGEGIRHGMEYFTPWTWKPFMFEVMNLFSHNCFNTCVSASSSNDELLSAYVTLSDEADSLAVILLNRSTSDEVVSLSCDNFDVANVSVPSQLLASLPDGNTFVSSSNNALVSGTVSVVEKAVSLSVPAYSVIAFKLPSASAAGCGAVPAENLSLSVFPNPSVGGSVWVGGLVAGSRVQVLDIAGRVVRSFSANSGSAFRLSVQDLSSGSYILRAVSDNGVQTARFVVR